MTIHMHFELKVVEQNKKTELEHYTFWNCYIQGAPQNRQNITASFAELVKTWRINDFYTYNLGKQWEIKIKKSESGHYKFWNC